MRFHAPMAYLKGSLHFKHCVMTMGVAGVLAILRFVLTILRRAIYEALWGTDSHGQICAIRVYLRLGGKLSGKGGEFG